MGANVVGLLFVLHPHQHGWRWAIYRATQAEFDSEPLSRCINAGFQPDQAGADDVGQQALYTVLNFARGLPVATRVEAVTLDHDPLPDVDMPAVQVSPEILQVGGS